MPVRLNAKYLFMTETLNVLYCLYWRVFANAIVDILSHFHTSLLITKKVKLINLSFFKTYDFDNEQNERNQILKNILEEEVFISIYILC